MVKDYNPYAENEFSWAQWTPNTELKLCNVTWDSSYRDIVKFVSRETQQSYFEGLAGETCAPGTMHKPTEPVLVEMPFNRASNWNYLVAYNDYPELETPRYWYYFIQSVEYVNAHTTRLYLMLDVWQSFQFDITIGSSYIVRGHIGVANERQFDDYGRTYLALPEGLDTGSEMVCTSQAYHSLVEVAETSPAPGVSYKPWVDYGVIVVSTTDLIGDPGTQSQPSMHTAGGSMFENMSNGASVYYCADRWSFIDLIMTRGMQYPWITQGIVSVYAIPKIPQDYLSDYGHPVTELFGKAVDGDRVYQFESATASTVRYDDITIANNFRSNFRIPERYRNLKKLWCYPYCVIECTCLNGTNIIYKPEDVQSDNLAIRMTYNYAPNGTRLNFYIPGYNEGGAQDITPIRYNNADYGLTIDGGEMLDASFGITNLPSFAVVNNGGAMALANTAYTRQYAQENALYASGKAKSAAWTQSTLSALGRSYATRQNQLAQSNANSMLALSQHNTLQSANLQNTFANRMTGLANDNTVNHAVTGTITGAFSGGGVMNAVNQAVGAGLSIWNNNRVTAAQNDMRSVMAETANSNQAAMTAQQNAYSGQSTSLANRQGEDVANVNLGYALGVAESDYRNALAGINAQVQQMRLTPPTTSGALGGDQFNLANGIMGILVRFKTCAPSALAAVGEYMLRYGYFVQRFLVPPANLMCMTRFTYWQMQECYIRGTLPEQYRMTIKGIFEKGTTVWAAPNDIGVLDWADNDPLPGISY